MGVYDTVIIPCPVCDEEYYAQSKGSDKCSFRMFHLSETPDDVMLDENRHAPFECEYCGTIFEIGIWAQARPRVIERKNKHEKVPVSLEINNSLKVVVFLLWEEYRKDYSKNEEYFAMPEHMDDEYIPFMNFGEWLQRRN